MSALLAALPLAILFVHPLQLPPGGRLWMFPPLALCMAIVYRVTRARNVREMIKPTIVTFFQIIVGMVLIALGFYVLHEIVIDLS